VDAPTRRRAAEAIEVAARAVPGRATVLSVSTSVSDTASESALVQTNGFEGTRRGTDFWLGAEVAVQDPDGRRPEEYAAAGCRTFAGLEAPEVVGRRAAERAQARVGAVKGASSLTTLVVEARAAGRLAATLLGPMSAGAIQQKRSFLEGKVGQPLFSPLLGVDDDPLVPRGFGSRRYDGEGMAARRRTMIRDGVLSELYVDTYYGRKLGLPPTTGRPSNLSWKLGTRPPAELLAAVGDGVLVTGFLGGNSNGTTGDFSLGIRGFAIRGGRVAEPVAEMNASGNLLELWKRLAAVGDDPYPCSATRTPTLVFEGVQVAGTSG
jgi:PmbA protein